MGFWIFMLVMGMLVPLSMIGFGRMFLKKAPNNINMAFGYRTTRSMKNKDTWTFAHEACGRLWQRLGWILLVVSVAFLLFFLGKDKDTVGTAGLICEGVQLVVLIGSIFPTERALRKTFDGEGNRRTGG